MNLHIFNPEHDIALASNLSNFTAPHAGRQLRHDLGFLPEVWAEEGDCILVDDVELAQYEGKKFLQAMARQLGRSLNRPNYQRDAMGLGQSIESQTEKNGDSLRADAL